MSVNAFKPHKALIHDSVDLRCGWKFLNRPDDLVPTETENPSGTRIGSRVGADTLDGVIHTGGAREIEAGF